VQPFCKSIERSLEGVEPWYKPKDAINIDGRIYHEPYSGTWVSYAAGERDGTTLSSYQWRAPGEWFAVVYSVAWMQKKRPSFVAGKLDEWMPA